MRKLNVTMRKYEVILGLIYIAAQMLLIPLILVTVNYLLPRPFSEAELNFASFAINFICVTAIFHRYLIECARIAFANIGRVFAFVGLGFAIYYAGNLSVNVLISQIDPNFFNVNDNSISAMLDQNGVLIMIGTVVLVPIVEETLYRGIIFGQLYKRSPIAGYIVSVAVFAALHVVGYIGAYPPIHLLLCFLQYLPASIALAWAYAQTGTIWTPTIMHTTVNLIGMLAMLVEA